MKPAQGGALIKVAQMSYASLCYYKSNRSQRLGQYMVNTFMTKDTIWPELFYEGDNAVASELFLSYLESQEKPDLPVSAP